MNVEELMTILSKIPSNAEVYIEADHGQQSKQSGRIFVTDEYFSDGKLPYYGEDIGWRDIEECDVGLISAVLIK